MWQNSFKQELEKNAGILPASPTEQEEAMAQVLLRGLNLSGPYADPEATYKLRRGFFNRNKLYLKRTDKKSNLKGDIGVLMKGPSGRTHLFRPGYKPEKPTTITLR